MFNSPNIFQSNGRQYVLVISLLPDAKMDPEDNVVALDIQGIEEFSYTSELNSLVLTGHISYVDRYGVVDKFIEQQNCICDVMFAELQVEEDGDIFNGYPDPDKSFMHRFIVNSLKIVKREGTVITYSIDVVSCNWYNCISNYAFSNNKEDPQPIFDILNTCLTNVGLKAMDSLKDKKVQTDVKINYSSQANDNLFKIFKYLMDKLYFWPSKDSSLKFLVYNWKLDQYGLIDLADTSTLMGSVITSLSFFKTNAELLTQATPSNVGSYSNDIAKTDMYMSMFKKNVYEYDFDKNEFTSKDSDIDEKSIVDYMNEHAENDGDLLKFHEISFPDGLKFEQNCTYWNLPVNVYFNVIDALYSNGALTLNRPGQILCQCGYAVIISVDRDMNALIDDSTEELKKLKTKYTGFEGIWIALKVVNVIRPTEGVFRQKIALFRNVTMKKKHVETVAEYE